MASSTKLEAGALIASRYRAEEPLAGDDTRPAYRGTDEQSGRGVVLIELPANDAGSLGPTLRTEHAHLAKVLDVIQAPGSTLLVVEQIVGTTLGEHVTATLGDHPVEAVRTILRVADAVSAIHALGGAHGCLRPEAVVFEPVGRFGPVVTFAPPVLGVSPYRSPERGDSGNPSEADDSWALGGLLHLLLTGRSPPVLGIASEPEIDPHVRDPVLRATLLHALTARAADRGSDLKTLKRELARWFVDHAGEEPSHPGTHSRPPPLPSAPPSQPLGPAVGPPTVSSVGGARGAVPRRRTKLVLALAVGGTVLGLGAAWAVSSLRKPPVQIVEAPASASAAEPAPPPSAHAIDLSEVPVTGGQPDAAIGDRMATCVAGYLPKGAFVARPKLDWLCDEPDPRLGAERLRTAIVQGGAQVQVTDAMKLFSRIGWYDMPAYAVLRGGCCPDAKPIELPPPVETCADMGQAIRDIAKNVLASQSADEPIERYGKSVDCEVRANRAYLFRHTGKALHYQELAFRDLIKAIEAP
jgi:eukaryotic-like serine/threonine-protein kinase